MAAVHGHHQRRQGGNLYGPDRVQCRRILPVPNPGLTAARGTAVEGLCPRAKNFKAGRDRTSSQPKAANPPELVHRGDPRCGCSRDSLPSPAAQRHRRVLSADGSLRSREAPGTLRIDRALPWPGLYAPRLGKEVLGPTSG